MSADDRAGRIEARQVEAHGRPGGVLLGISTSGGSRNVLAAMTTARERALTTVALTGRDGGAVGREADIHINVAASSTARVQEVQITVLHILCDLVERELTASSSVERRASSAAAPHAERTTQNAER